MELRIQYITIILMHVDPGNGRFTLITFHARIWYIIPHVPEKAGPEKYRQV